MEIQLHQFPLELSNILLQMLTNGDTIASVSLGIIKYTSANAYYIPEEKQSYVYEAGAIITNQTKGSSISIKPSFKPIKPESAGDNKILFSVVNISSVGGKISMGGYDTVPIQTEFFIDNVSNPFLLSKPLNNTKYLTIETSYPIAWSVFLNSSLSGYGGTYTIQSTGDSVKVTFDSIQPDIYLNVIDIFGQIGPGWVE